MAVIMHPDPASNMAKPDWGKPQFASHTWIEPIIVFSIMIASCYFNRRRGFRIRPSPSSQGLLDNSKEEFDEYDSPDELSIQDEYPATNNPPKKRSCCGTLIHTPNSSRFANHWHSRFIQKFPFLVEMFYWVLNLLFYVCTKPVTEILFSNDSVWETAKRHGESVFDLEHNSWASFLFPLKESDFQNYLMNGHPTALTFLNRAYSLVHIPGTVTFLSWYYYSAPTHETFAIVRRMMTLTNLLTFTIFTFYPCMPPRLLDERYGFHDTVRHDDADSVWTKGKFFNQLAAMPSLHFGYSFCIGTTLIYHSGIFRKQLARRETRKSKFWRAFYVILGISYPSTVLTVIIATANHYWLDALAASIVVGIAFLCNRFFLTLLPLEDIFLWATRLEKPVPTTGDRLRRGVARGTSSPE